MCYTPLVLVFCPPPPAHPPLPRLSSFGESFQRLISICFLNYLFSSSDIPDMALNSCHILLHSLAALVRQGWCLLPQVQESILRSQSVTKPSGQSLVDCPFTSCTIYSLISPKWSSRDRFWSIKSNNNQYWGCREQRALSGVLRIVIEGYIDLY